MEKITSSYGQALRLAAVSRYIPFILILVVLLPACGSGSGTLAEVDPNAAPQDPTFEQVFSVIERQCVPCHGPAGPALSTCDEIKRSLQGIDDTSVTGNSMPPGAWPRLTSREKLMLRRWLDNGAPSPCD